MLKSTDVPFAHPVDGGASAATRDFRRQGDSRYTLTLLEIGVAFEVDRLRRERHELIGELTVRCNLPGARTVGDILSRGDFNFSSVQARQQRGKLLGECSKAPEMDWLLLLEEFVYRVTEAERTGEPAVLLRNVPAPSEEIDFDVCGFRFPRHHPTVEFGDGGTLKSYHALFLAGQLEHRGVRVGYFDWELEAGAHRQRLERLFGADMPSVRYVRCERPLVYEVDRLRRIVQDECLDYVFNDSVAFACAGPPEAAEMAGEYFRALRQLRVGSFNIAHITKGENADQRPFGSVFWHNGARSTWYVKLAAGTPGDTEVTIGLFNRKANLGPLAPALGFRILFEGSQTSFTRVNLADVHDLAEHLPLAVRIAQVLRRGPLTLAVIADELGAKVDSVEKAVKRGEGRQFTRTPGKDGIYRVALVERRDVA